MHGGLSNARARAPDVRDRSWMAVPVVSSRFRGDGDGAGKSVGPSQPGRRRNSRSVFHERRPSEREQGSGRRSRGANPDRLKPRRLEMDRTCFAGDEPKEQPGFECGDEPRTSVRDPSCAEADPETGAEVDVFALDESVPSLGSALSEGGVVVENRSTEQDPAGTPIVEELRRRSTSPPRSSISIRHSRGRTRSARSELWLPCSGTFPQSDALVSNTLYHSRRTRR